MTFCGYDEPVVQTPPIGVAVQSHYILISLYLELQRSFKYYQTQVCVIVYCYLSFWGHIVW